MTIFAPAGDSESIAVTQTDQRVAIPTLPAESPAIRLIAQQSGLVALWVNLGDVTVTGSVTTSMRVRPGTLEQPLYIGINDSETHISIFCEGSPGNVILTAGRMIDGPPGPQGPAGTGDVVGPASSVNNSLAAFDGTTGKLIKDSGISIADVLTEAEAAVAYQPLDSDLTAIAALTTTAIGRSLLAAADAPAIAEIAGVGVTDSPTNVNHTLTGYLDLTEIAAPASPSANVARLYAYDAGGKTKVAFKDSSGTVFDVSSDTVSIKDFGAVGDGSTDDTAAFTAAITALNAGTFTVLYIPEGAYIVDDTFTITRDGIAIFGEGIRVSRIHQQSAQDTFIISAAVPASNMISDIIFQGFGIDYGDVTAPAAGCALRMTRLQRGYFINIDIRSVFQGIDIEGGHELFFDSFSCHGAFSWSSVASQSFLFRTRKGPADHVPSEIFVSNFNMKGFTSAGPNNYLENAIIILSADGLWINNGHVGFTDQSDILINPQNDAAASIVNIEFSNVYADGNFGGDAGGAGLTISGSLTSTVRHIKFADCIFKNHEGHGINVDRAFTDLRFINCQITDNGAFGAIFNGITNLNFSHNYIALNNGNNSSSNALELANVANAVVEGNIIQAGTSTHPVGINIPSSVTDIVIANNVIEGHTTQVVNSSPSSVVLGNIGVFNNAIRTTDTFYAQGGTPGFWLDETDGGVKGAYAVLDGGNLQIQRRATAFGAFEATLVTINISSGLATFSGGIKSLVTTVASLPAAGTAGAGATAFVTNANATTFASVVAGGGANGVPVYSDGTNWRIG